MDKQLGSAERDTEIARVRGITLAEIFSHDDHLLTSQLFDSDFTSATRGSIGGIYIIDDVGVGIEYNCNVVL